MDTNGHNSQDKLFFARASARSEELIVEQSYIGVYSCEFALSFVSFGVDGVTTTEQIASL